jgi:hypothetical protein
VEYLEIHHAHVVLERNINAAMELPSSLSKLGSI